MQTMTTNKSVKEAMDKSDTPTHSVDYYYLEAMRYLSCSDHRSDDSDHECSCRRCQREEGDPNDSSIEKLSISRDRRASNDDGVGRERSWSHSIVNESESGTISQLPNLDGKVVGGRLKNRRFSDGMLLKTGMKVSDGRVHWADESKKELTRTRPRKTYQRKPALKSTPVRSILKNSEENLSVHLEDEYSDYDEDEDAHS